MTDSLVKMNPSTAAAPAPAPAAIDSDDAIDAGLLEEVDEYFEAGAEVRAGDVVVDVGANVGAFARRVAERAAGRITVHCFEPAPESFRALERACASDPWLSRAQTSLHRVALTREELAGQERPFYYFSRIPTNSTYDLADKHAEYSAYFQGKAAAGAAVIAARVPLVGWLFARATTFLAGLFFHRRNLFAAWLANRATGLVRLTCQTDSLERWSRRADVRAIDLLKVDVEGAELDVLLGCGELWPNVRQVALEAHDRDGRIDAIVALLEQHGLSQIRRLRPRVAEKTGLDNVLLVARRPDQVSGTETNAH